MNVFSPIGIISILFLLFISYILGSIPFALIVGKKFANIDVRNFDSGNLGGTNVIRNVGTKLGILVILLDALKAFLPTFLALFIFGENIALIAGVFAIIGHMFPLFAKFKGGKGVASGVGVMFAITWPISLIAMAVFALVLLISKFVSLGSIIASLSVILMMIINSPLSVGHSIFIRAITIIVGCFVIYKHKTNIIKIKNGTEKSIIKGKK